MKKKGYSSVLLIILLLGMIAATAGPALALPSTDTTITDPYKDGRNVTLNQLSNKTVTNSPQEPTREHDPNKTQVQQEAYLAADSALGYLTGGPHGRYTDNTGACGRCHQLHQAKSQRLIRFEIMPAGSTANNIIYGTCTYCHTFNGQSTYDVKDGMIWDTNDGKRYATSGGGFERMLVVEGEPAMATVVKASASHRVNYSTGTKFRAPGGYNGSNTDAHIELTCSSCHNPHGSRNSRQLRENVWVGDTSGTKVSQATSDPNTKVIVKVQNPFGDETVNYNAQINNFCRSCHWDYMSGNAKNKTGVFDLKFRHKIGMAPDEGLNDGSRGFGYNPLKFQLPVANLYDNGTAMDPWLTGTVVCVTCHYAHGTFAVVKGIATGDSIVVSSGTDPVVDLQNLDGTRTEPPKNLRLDNRGVCQNCHDWPDVAKNPPALVDVLNPSQSGTLRYGETGTLLSNTKVTSPTADTVIIRFNQYVLKGQSYVGSAEITGNYTLKKPDMSNVAIATATVQPDGRTVVLRLGENLINGTTYTLTVQSVKDTNFNLMNTITESFTK